MYSVYLVMEEHISGIFHVDSSLKPKEKNVVLSGEEKKEEFLMLLHLARMKYFLACQRTELVLAQF